MAIDYTRRTPRVPPARAGGAARRVDYRHPRRQSSTRISYDHPGRAPRGATPSSTNSDLTGRGWALSSNPDGGPWRFAPEHPVEVWWNIDQAGRWAFDDIQAALWQVHLATGLDFSFGGETDRIPQLADYDDARPPEHPSLTIAWAKPGAVRGGSDLLDPEALRASVPRDRPTGSEGMAVGIGGWRGTGLRWGDNEPWAWCITSAHVVIDSTLRELSPPGFGVGNCRGAVLLHELAHAVGLGHVDEPTELMYPVVTDKPAAYGPGDLEGLRRVGEAAGPVF